MHQQLTQVPGLAYSTLVHRLPYKPLATDDFRRGVRAMMPTAALGMRNIAPDLPYAVNWLKFDLDFAESAAKWVDEDLPRPHFVVVNPANGNSHYLYGLEKPVVSSGQAKRGPLDYLNAITVGYGKVLQADTAYPGKFCKTPTHPAWQTHIHNGPLYTLETLASALPPSLSTKKVARTEAVGLGRNVTLFDELRQWAYGQALAARSRGHYPAWQTAVQQEASRLNAFTSPLPQSEVRAAARSVARWTWKNAHRFSASILGGSEALEGQVRGPRRDDADGGASAAGRGRGVHQSCPAQSDLRRHHFRPRPAGWRWSAEAIHPADCCSGRCVGEFGEAAPPRAAPPLLR